MRRWNLIYMMSIILILINGCGTNDSLVKEKIVLVKKIENLQKKIKKLENENKIINIELAKGEKDFYISHKKELEEQKKNFEEKIDFYKSNIQKNTIFTYISILLLVLFLILLYLYLKKEKKYQKIIQDKENIIDKKIEEVQQVKNNVEDLKIEYQSLKIKLETGAKNEVVETLNQLSKDREKQLELIKSL